MALGTECAGYPSQLAAVRAMALAGVGRAEIRQRTGLDSHRVGSLLAKVRAEARGDAPAWDAAREASARRIYRAGVLVMAEHFGVTVAEFLLHATGVPGAGQEASADGVLGPEGWSDGDVGAAGDGNLGQLDERDGADGAGDDAADATAPRPDAPPPPLSVEGPPVPGDAGEGQAADAAQAAQGGTVGDAAAGAAEAPAAADAAGVRATDDELSGVAAVEPDAADALSGDRAAPALPDTETEGEVHLRSWDGQRLHVNGRMLTRIPRFYWRGSREAAEVLRRKLPAAWALSMVPAWRVP